MLREGGSGDNLFGKDILAELEKMKNDKLLRANYVLLWDL